MTPWFTTKVNFVLMEFHLAEVSNINGYAREIVAIIHNEFQFGTYIDIRV